MKRDETKIGNWIKRTAVIFAMPALFIGCFSAPSSRDTARLNVQPEQVPTDTVQLAAVNREAVDA